MENIIATGAEAILIHKDNRLIKRRIKKSYRLKEIDEKLRKARTKKESRLLEKAYKFIPVPKILKMDEKSNEIEIEFIEGKKLSTHLDNLPNAIEICKTIGNQIAILHDNDIIHGDLTTSNMILSNKDNKIYFIDFGLGFESKKPEDKAVDLHLIKQALEAKHFAHYKEFFNAILEGYKSSKNYKTIFNRLAKVEARGRYKQQAC